MCSDGSTEAIATYDGSLFGLAVDGARQSIAAERAIELEPDAPDARAIADLNTALSLADDLAEGEYHDAFLAKLESLLADLREQ